MRWSLDLDKGEGAVKVTIPTPLFIEGGKRAVLLLHGFTGNSADVRMLGRFLEKKGYTCYAPHYKGHGVPPEELIHTGPKDWWEDVLEAYGFLKKRGYEEIAVAGLSLGGVFSLKLGYTLPVKGVITMCAPMSTKNKEVMYKGVLAYARKYKEHEGKSKEKIDEEMSRFQPMNTLEELKEEIDNVRENIDLIEVPVFAIQARHDTMIDPDSVNVIFDGVSSIIKKQKWFENSGHVITIGPEKDIMHEDIYEFLESLTWEE